ncbi:LysE family translocator [Baekduia soli]|uniref:LysE family translocator n=1 Tax=Baekduia soli TaxID=496014 RepID=A0A5B8U2I5_9ACTN|nr:LysE family translocator [Baekduia soli]QEC47075.1 LysE family translocator [Baekduia soli]
MDAVSPSAALGIALIAFGLVLTPGPNMLYLVSRSLTQGRRAGLISLIGTALGFLVYLAAATLGITAIFTSVPTAYTALRIAGAAYLLWLAWGVLRPGAPPIFTVRELSVDPPRRLIGMGLLTNLLNPKIAVLYVSLLPQFVDADRGSVALQSFVLGAIQIVIAVTFNGVFVLLAGALAMLLARRPALARAQRLLMGTALGAFGVRLLVERSR